MQTIMYDPSPSIQDSARSSDHSKLTYPQLFSPFRVFPSNQLPPNYPIAQQYHSFRVILRCSSATTAYSAMPKPNHLVAQKNCTAAKAAQFWRLTCAPNQRFGQVIKKSNPSEQCQQEVTFMISGAQTRNRTKDTGIFSPLLYQLSYLGKLLIYNCGGPSGT